MFSDKKTQFRIFALFLGVLVLGALALWFAWRSLAEEERLNQDFEHKLRLLRDVNDVRAQAADMNGWQTAYAFQIRRRMPDATSDDSPLRNIFLNTWKVLERKLAALPVEQFSEQEVVDYQSAWRLLREYAEHDRNIIAAYRLGTPADVAQATERVMYAEMTLFQQISYSLANLSESMMARSNEASASARRATAHTRRVLMGLGAASLALILLLAFTVARFMAKRAELLARLDVLARTDGLTGVANRRQWDEQLQQALERAAREEVPVCVALVDLDHFKQFNDTHGHQAGDARLRELAQSFSREINRDSLVARYGGEEFALLFYDYDRKEASALLDKLRRAAPSGQTFSAGLIQCVAGDSAAHVLAQADRALYQAKAQGRNRIEQAPQPAPAPRDVPSVEQVVKNLVTELGSRPR